MALPACFRLADDVFPRVRAEAARRLVSSGWSQTRTASALAVSQAMVSKYASRTESEHDALVLQLTDALLKELEAPADEGSDASWCQVLAPADGRAGGTEALEDLLAAERSLVDAPPHEMVPQIGLNITRCTDDARDATQVLAYPGRLVAAGPRLIAPVPPAWGASSHLAGCLLALRQADATVRAIANVRGSAEVVAAAEQAVGPVHRVVRGNDGSDAPVLEAFAAGHTRVHDPGAVGIEPCLYVAGATAQNVALTIHSIHERLLE